MSKSTRNAGGAAAPAAAPAADVHTRALPPRDGHTGVGGTYMRDPATGKRTLVERPGSTSQAPAQPQEPAAE